MSANILVVEDLIATQELILEALREAGDGFQARGVGTSRRALEHLAAHDTDCVLLDHDLPDGNGLKCLHKIRELRPTLPVIIVTVCAKAPTIVEAMRLGAVDYVVKEGNYPRELVRKVREALGTRHLHQALRPTTRPSTPLTQERLEDYRRVGLLGDSPTIRNALADADRAASNRASVLLQGGTGTGKELFAQAIHYNGARANGSFITVNCPAIPKEMLESELFGHVKGAFTGAIEAHRGFFERAEGGTIFLDEIGEIGIGVQAKLLRVLENGEIHPLGADFTRRVHVRVIAASNRDLRCASAIGTFREDLYFRLSAIRITLPTLRDRPTDIVPIFKHYLARFGKEEQREPGPVTRETANLLTSYSWPGNVRQLRNEAHRVIGMADAHEPITPDLLSPDILVDGLDTDDDGTLKDVVHRVERAEIRRRLRKFGYNKTATAKSLGMTREGLHVKMAALGMKESPPSTDE